MINKGSYVEIEVTILNSDERAPRVPEDTKAVPLKMIVKGTLLNDSNLGEIVKIVTPTKRIEEGILINKDPAFYHNFGGFVEELKRVREIILAEVGDFNE